MDWTTAVLLLALRVTAAQPRISESVTVMAEARLSGAGTATVLTTRVLESTPALTLDDALRSTPGFTLFRRSSSRAANPTTQGVTLRGLAASGASRAAVLADNVPLTDPVGGWVYWNRIPAAAVARVEVLRGPSGDLVSDALGGTIRISTAGSGAALLAEGGDDSTVRLSAFIGTPFFGAAEWFTTDGYVPVAPETRGPIDTRASARHASVHLGSDIVHNREILGRVSGAYFDESRRNGTPLQRNATRLAQVSGLLIGDLAGGTWTMGSYGAVQHYEQTFSAVLQGRAGERPTSSQDVDALSAESWFEWGRSGRRGDLTLTGSGRYVAAELLDVPAGASVEDASPTEARQVTGAISAHAALHPWMRTTLTAGARAAVWSTWRRDSPESSSAVFLNPRVSLTYAAAPGVRLRLGVQSGSRGPTVNELYRAFRVGNILTLPNARLTPEHAHAIESSVLVRLPARTALRAVAFWTRVDDAIANVTQPSPPDSILRQRLNAARIRARGVELETEANLKHGFTLHGSAAFTDSVFDRGPLQGLRVPQVPRFQAAIGMRGGWPRAQVSVEWRFIGHQFDDDRNQLALGESSVLDMRAGWLPKQGVEVFVAIENLLDAEQDVGRTPLRTVGLPRSIRAGVRLRRR